MFTTHLHTNFDPYHPVIYVDCCPDLTKQCGSSDTDSDSSGGTKPGPGVAVEGKCRHQCGGHAGSCWYELGLNTSRYYDTTHVGMK